MTPRPTAKQGRRKSFAATAWAPPGCKKSVVFADEDGGAENGGPKPALVADRGLSDVQSAHDFIGNSIDFFFLVPGKIRIEFDVQRGGQHFRGEFFRVFASDFFAFAEGMVLGEIAVHGFVAGKRQADAGGDQAVRFLGGIFTDHGERDLSWLDVLQAFAAGNQFTTGREDRRDANDVTCGDARIAQRQLKTGKPLTMFTDTFGQKNLLSDKRHSAGTRPPYK